MKAATIRVILTLAVINQWKLHQLDVNNAFLHGNLTDIVYMKQPPGFIDPRYPDHACKLHKAMYGLQQAPRAWFHRLSSFLVTNGFVCSRADPSLFNFKRGACVLYLLVYVDDLILTGSDSSLIRSFIHKLHAEFKIKDLGQLNYFLGLEAKHLPLGFFSVNPNMLTPLLTVLDFLIPSRFQRPLRPTPDLLLLERYMRILLITGLLLGRFNI